MLEVRDIYKMYEGKPLLRGVSFTVSAGETVCLLGPSGSGKSTLLRIIAGLEAADAGRVLWDGQNLSAMPVHQRRFGLMFQDYALFPHKSVYENVAFGLRMQGMPKDEIEVRVQEGLQQVNMKAFAQRRVTDLSGGEQQRVALARALAPRPRLLMLDEPLGALDRTLREQLTEELHQLLQSSGVPAIYVTHDQEEAFAIGDRLILLNNGLVTQEGSPDEVYQRPNSMWAARFLGLSNLLPGEVVSSSPLQVQTELGRMPASCSDGDAPTAGSQVTLLLRPWGAGQSADSTRDFPLQGEVEDVVFRVEGFRVTLRVRPELSFQFYMDERLETGQRVTLHLPPEGIYCLPETAPAEGDG